MVAPLIAKQLFDQGKVAIDSDLFVVRRHYPAVIDKKGRVVDPAKDTELHVNPKGLLFLAGAGFLGAVALGGSWIAWNGIKVVNPVPFGDRILTIVPGVKDNQPEWLKRQFDRSEARRAQRDSDRIRKEREAFDTANRAACLAGGGTWNEATKSCSRPAGDPHGPRSPLEIRLGTRVGGVISDYGEEFPDPLVVRACGSRGGSVRYDRVTRSYYCVLPLR